MGNYDCAALIDYILENTSQKSLTFIGQAQGATQLIVLVSTKPEYATKVKHMVALAPFVYMSHISNPILRIVKDHYSIVDVSI